MDGGAAGIPGVDGGAAGIPGVDAREKYVSLETYRAGGGGVRTPVCFVVSGSGTAYFLTRSRTGKARRLAANPAVSVAPCTMRGAVTGQWARGTAVPASGDEAGMVVRMRRKKYGLLDVLARLATRSKGGIVVYRLAFGGEPAQGPGGEGLGGGGGGGGGQ